MPPIRGRQERSLSPNSQAIAAISIQASTPRRRRTNCELDAFTRTQICTLKNIAGYIYKQI